MPGYRGGYDRGGDYRPARSFYPRSAFGYDDGYRRRGPGGYDRGWQEARPDAYPRRDWAPWWIGGLDRGRETSGYDRTYQDFHDRHHPRYSPVGGNYHAMGGSYMRGGVPRPLREGQWFSDWTRWF